jgi:pyridoxamine 5'-phosphate oxidase
MDLRDHRKIYTKFELLESEVNTHPIEQFKLWYQEAKESAILEANAMTLATATLDGKPSARVVLLKEVKTDGFVFFTNYLSRKGIEISENPQAQILFFWDVLERQVRIEGTLEKLPRAESQIYFDSRPEESRAGAIVSPQSQQISNRAFLEEKLNTIDTSNLQMPDHWGGYILKPTYIEFWQGRHSRLHDRIFYAFENEQWTIGRLAP